MAGAALSIGGGFLSGGWKGAAMMGLDYLTSGKQVVQNGNRLTDRSVQVAELGYRVPKIYGRHRTAAAMVWAPRAGLREIRDETSGSGKDRTKYITYRYALSAAWLICGQSTRLWEITYNDFPIYQWNGTTETIDKSLATGARIFTNPRTGEVIPDTGGASVIGAFALGWQIGNLSAQTTFDPTTGTYSLPEFRIYTGTETQLPDSLIETDIGVGKTPAMRGQTVFVTDSFVIEPPVGTMAFEVEGLYSDIAQVCLDIWADCGVPSALVDVSAIDRGENVDGFMLDTRAAGRDALQELARNHYFDWVHRDGKEVAVPRGGNVVVSIPRGDLRCRLLQAPGPGIDNPPETVLNDADIVVLPQREELQYHDRARQYHPNVRAAWRDAPPFGDQQDKEAISTGEVLDGAHAQKLVDILLHTKWEEAQTVKFLVGNEYRFLQPTDPLELPTGYNGAMVRWRATSMQKQHPGGVLSGLAVRESPDLYGSPLGEDSEGLPAVTISEIGDITLFVFQTNALRDTWANGVSGTLPAPTAYAYAAKTSGSTTVRLSALALDSVTDFETFLTNATMGYAVGILADFAYGSAIFDEVSTLDVDLIRGSLESASSDDILADPRLNQALVNQEIIQFRDAVYVGEVDGKHRYTISGLLRGERGTEWATGTHADGDAFALTNVTQVLQFEPAYIGREIVMQINVAGPDDALSLVIEGDNLKPFSPVNVRLTNVAMDGSITAEWDNRTRFADAAEAFIQTGVEPPMGETVEKYEVDFLNSLGGVVDTLHDLPSKTFTYDAARIVAKYGGLQSTYRVDIYQVSALAGRGYKAHKELVV